MIGTSVPEYIFIRACIFVLHWIAPFSIFISVLSLAYPLPFHIPFVARAWAALETAFYFFIYHPRKIYLQRAAVHPPRLSREDRHILFQRCHDNIPNPERYLQGWFMNAPASEIKRENVKDFFNWSFLNTGHRGIEDEDELEEYTVEFEKLLGRTLQPGRGRAKCFRLTLNKVDMLHRSLTWYLCVSVVDTLAYLHMRYHAFDFHRTSRSRFHVVFPFRPITLLTPHRSPANTLTYWHRPHTSTTRLPILFIHGIGIGLYPYVKFLAELNQTLEDDTEDGEVGIIAVEIMNVSLRITNEAMQKEQMCAEIDCILNAHGWDEFVLVSHSYGSIISTHLLSTPKIASKIGPILFIDPVSFLLHLPDVAYNFICRKPQTAPEHQLSYFASKDPGISHTLLRRFFWSENIIFKEELLGHPTTVSLGGKDLIVDTKSVKRYLTGDQEEKRVDKWKDGVWKGDSELDVMWFPELDHAQVFDKRATRKRLVSVVRAYCKDVQQVGNGKL